MNTLQRIGIGAAALLLAIGLLAPRSAEATHFRGMYVYVSDLGPGGEVEITVVQFWRYSAFGSSLNRVNPGFDGNEPEIGDVVQPSDIPFNGHQVALGDGTTYGDDPSETWTVDGLDSPQDWVVISATFTHTYSTAGTKTIQLDDCCRIEDLSSKYTEGFNVEATIDTENLGATTSSGPFVGVPQGTNVTFQVPFTNPDNDQLRFRLATPSEMGASGSNPPDLSINPTTGEITWDNSGLSQGSLWAVQVIIEEYDQGVDPANNPPKATVPSDFMFKVAAQGNEQPVCDLNPSSTTVSPGDQVSIDVTGSDAEGDADDDPDNTVRISSTSLPGGTLNPNPQVGTSPQTATFNWTPGNTGTFNAQFSVGDGLTTTLCTATIDVETQQTCDVPTLSQDDIDQNNRTLSNTMQDDEGVAEFTFTTLDNFTVDASSLPSGYTNTSGNTWEWTGSGDPETSVDFTLEAGPDNTSTYFLEVTDACEDPGPNTVTFDPAYEFGPAASEAQLAGNAPNPFSGQTTVEFDLAEQSRVTVAVYDMMGRKIATLVDGVRSAGPHAVGWNGQSDSGQDLASGVYLLRMQAEGKTMTKRMTIIR